MSEPTQAASLARKPEWAASRRARLRRWVWRRVLGYKSEICQDCGAPGSCDVTGEQWIAATGQNWQRTGDEWRYWDVRARRWVYEREGTAICLLCAVCVNRRLVKAGALQAGASSAPCFCGHPDDRERVHRAHACEPWTQRGASTPAD